MASALLNLSLGKRERGKEKKEGEKEKGREGEQVRARGATVPGLPSLRNLGSLGAPPLQSGLIPIMIPWISDCNARGFLTCP